MKLLVVTQTVDRDDPTLGFFHAWLQMLAHRFERVTVICLKKGKYDLPDNVRILSLGKENKASRWRYIWRFYRFCLGSRRDYDAVFVHMNPEYVILGGPIWRVLHKKVLLWYTHKAVNLRLRLAEKFATKIFTASKASFRLPSNKVEVVGHGIAVDNIPIRTVRPMGAVKLLWVGRITPVKDLETAVLAVQELRGYGANLQLDVIGDTAIGSDVAYKQTLVALVHELGLEKRVHFAGPLAHQTLLSNLAEYDIFIHTSKTGSTDKVVLEALAAGLYILTSSEAYPELGNWALYFPANDSKKLAQSIEKIIHSDTLGSAKSGREFVVRHHNLDNLIGKIVGYFNS